MRLLFDQNLSFKLCNLLADLFPDSTQARLIGMEQSDDVDLWEYARVNEYVIVTQDVDFFNRSAVHGFPPKISGFAAAISAQFTLKRFCALTSMQ
jgi:predicted nuclease of predicted toxin-antitoxin system